MPVVEMHHPDLKLQSIQTGFVNWHGVLGIGYWVSASFLTAALNPKSREEVQSHPKLRIRKILKDTGRHS
jgi:hypothetical protein